MKPKEFDDLVRQKFDQNDFAYNPRNWERLAEQMDGRAKKRSIMMWWLMPLAGVAASVALAMGVIPAMKQGVPAAAEMAQTRTITTGGQHSQNPATQSGQPGMLAASTPAASADAYSAGKKAAKSKHMHIGSLPTGEEYGEEVRISLKNAVPNASKSSKAEINLLDKDAIAATKKDDKKKNEPEVVSTFKPEASQKTPRTSLIINGGYNQGSISNGYVAGATIRRMVSDKVYVESDLDFASVTNIQVNGKVSTLWPPADEARNSGNTPGNSFFPAPSSNAGNLQGTPTGGSIQITPVGGGGYIPGAGAMGGPIASARIAGSGGNNNSYNNRSINAQPAMNIVASMSVSHSVTNMRVTMGNASGPAAPRNTHTHSGAKTTSTTSTTDGTGNTTTKPNPIYITSSTQVPYSMNYVQLCPSIGVNITKRISIGAGADVQQALADSRPAFDPTYNGTEQQAPLFDMGLLAKTEYAVTKKLRASVYYRKGVNNLFTPDKYSERDYLQLQLKCVIFNK